VRVEGVREESLCGRGRASWQLAPRTRPSVDGAMTGWHRMDWKEQKSTELTDVVPLAVLWYPLLECRYFATLASPVGHLPISSPHVHVLAILAKE